LKSLFIQCARLALALVVGGLLFTACGGGDSEVANNGAVTAVVSPARVVAGQIYAYKADAPGNASVTWSWGDGSPDTVGNTVQKVWHKPGSFTITLSAVAGGTTVLAKQGTVVAGEPVSAGRDHTCALQPGGTVRCWGDNTFGALGDGTAGENKTATVPVIGLRDAIALSTGALHTCALRANGGVACWGANSSGQLGNNTTTQSLTPTAVVGLVDAVAISAGDSHTCALKASGSVACWGSNNFAQLGSGGNGTTTHSLSPVAVNGLADAVAISAGGAHTCALKADRTAACWGNNDSGQLGIGPNANDKFKTSATQVIGLTDAVALSAGLFHTCALQANGNAACWGRNDSGELGDGTTVTRAITSAVTGLTDAVAINAGGNSTDASGYRGRTCALKANGSAACWGDQGYAGSSSVQEVQATPIAVVGLTSTAALSMGGDHACALKASGAIACWGNNRLGQLGDGSIGSKQTQLVAVVAPGGGPGLLSDAVQLGAGPYHTCALKTDGTAACWGNNRNGELGNGTTSQNFSPTPTPTPTPTFVSNLTDAVELSVGGNHGCARKTDGSVACWGRNFYGQLGNGTTTNSLTPVEVGGLSGVEELGAGGAHTCARKTDSSVVCWGNNEVGQLGNGTTTDSLTPTPVNDLDGVAALNTGSGHTCARKTDGTVVCWGNNDLGQLGNGTTTQSLTPTLVSNLSGVVELSAGLGHTCARKTDGSVVCWGHNRTGQLGNGTTNDSLTPTLVSQLNNVVELSTRNNHTCARKTDGTAVCWGDNSAGQLGNDTHINSLVPTPVSRLSSIVELSAGWLHTCARKTDGTVVCWGNNGQGQLGGTSIITDAKLIPTSVLGGAIFWK
jgi:alpha-tubulin suppressor-like RCC1 family protein